MQPPRWIVPVALTAAVAAAAPATAAAAVRVSARPVTTALSAKAAKTTIAVTNGGRRAVGGLMLSVASARGVKVTLAGARRGTTSRALPSLKAGRTARVTVSLKAAGRAAPPSGSLTVKVTRRGRAVATAKLAFGPTAPPVDPNSLAGRYFWGSLYTISGIQQNTLWFTGPNLVWTEAAEGSFPTCTAVSEQCKPYTYDARTRALTIDGKPATLDGRKLKLDGDTYFEWGFPPVGTRWDTYVTYSNSSGICPLYCSYYTENLTFLPDGTFVRGAVSSGSGPVVDWAAVPADSKGTYEVRADHTLRLAFADGRERIETVALYMRDDGTLQPVGDGLLLDGDGYFDIRD